MFAADPYTPSAEELQDPELFAENVRKVTYCRVLIVCKCASLFFLIFLIECFKLITWAFFCNYSISGDGDQSPGSTLYYDFGRSQGQVPKKHRETIVFRNCYCLCLEVWRQVKYPESVYANFLCISAFLNNCSDVITR
jgi:hypothetical protein